MNYLLMTIGQIFEALAFFASLPVTVFASLAQSFYLAGGADNNDEQE